MKVRELIALLQRAPEAEVMQENDWWERKTR